jgi:hypothetical protein
VTALRLSARAERPIGAPAGDSQDVRFGQRSGNSLFGRELLLGTPNFEAVPRRSHQGLVLPIPHRTTIGTRVMSRRERQRDPHHDHQNVKVAGPFVSEGDSEKGDIGSRTTGANGNVGTR